MICRIPQQGALISRLLFHHGSSGASRATQGAADELASLLFRTVRDLDVIFQHSTGLAGGSGAEKSGLFNFFFPFPLERMDSHVGLAERGGGVGGFNGFRARDPGGMASKEVVCDLSASCAAPE